MKKLTALLLVISFVSAKADWMSDLESLTQSKELQDLGRQIQADITPLMAKYRPMIENIARQYGPLAKKYAEKAVQEGVNRLQQVPVNLREQIITQAQNVSAQAVAFAEAQAAKNPELVKVARKKLAEHQDELKKLERIAIRQIKNNPRAVQAVRNFIDQNNVDVSVIKNKVLPAVRGSF